MNTQSYLLCDFSLFSRLVPPCSLSTLDIRFLKQQGRTQLETHLVVLCSSTSPAILPPAFDHGDSLQKENRSETMPPSAPHLIASGPEPRLFSPEPDFTPISSKNIHYTHQQYALTSFCTFLLPLLFFLHSHLQKRPSVIGLYYHLKILGKIHLPGTSKKIRILSKPPIILTSHLRK